MSTQARTVNARQKFGLGVLLLTDTLARPYLGLHEDAGVGRGVSCFRFRCIRDVALVRIRWQAAAYRHKVELERFE